MLKFHSEFYSSIILSAGMGKRLNPFTDYEPKALVRVRGKPLIEYILEFLKNSSIKKITVVGGYKKNILKEYLEINHPYIDFVENDEYQRGNILSLLSAREELQSPFILVNVDHIYPPSMLEKFLNSPGSIVAGVDFNRTLGADDMKVKLNSDGKILNISKTLSDFDCGYIGMTICREDGLSLYHKAMKNVLENKGGDACVEEILQELSNMKTPPSICNLNGFRWFEIDDSADLLIAEKYLPKYTHLYPFLKTIREKHKLYSNPLIDEEKY